jgi:hypothetical protein
MNQKITLTAAGIVIGTALFLAGRGSVARMDETSSDAGKSQARSWNAGAPGARTSSRGTPDKRDASGRTRPVSADARRAKLESILRGEDSVERIRALMSFLDKLSPSELQEAMDHLASFKLPVDRSGEFTMLLVTWAKADPSAALAYAEENSPGSGAIRSILATWVANDPEGAIAWAKTHDAGDANSPCLAGLIPSLAATDPVRATSLLAEFPRGDAFYDVIKSMVPQVLMQGDEATRQWISGTNDELIRANAVLHAVKQLAASDPRSTADWLQSMPGGKAGGGMDEVLKTWMTQDPVAATAYYQSMPAGEARSSALNGMIGTLDLREAAALIDSNPADANHLVLQTFANRHVGAAPDLAFQYTGKIQDPEMREACYQCLVDNWLRSDRAAATAYLEFHPLPGGVQDHVNKKLGR